MNVYRGGYRRQVGGNIFGRGFRQAIPFIFRQILRVIKPKLISAGKEVGKSVLRAGVGAAGNLISTDFKNPKQSIFEPIQSEMHDLKRRFIPQPEQQGSGMKRPRKNIKKSINKAQKGKRKHKQKTKPTKGKKKVTKRKPRCSKTHKINDIFS